METDTSLESHCDRDDPNETEVTPEMIEAGVSELLSYNLDFESEESAVSRIFRAMVLAGRCQLIQPRL